MKLVYFNDTKKLVRVHPATFIHGCTGKKDPIQPLEAREFFLPKGAYPWVKLWELEGDLGFMILVSPSVG